jgi:hypothetical protein
MGHSRGKTDILVVGGGTGGTAAALAAARCGLRVIVTEETDWIGGQLTAQAVPPDENWWIEQPIGVNASYRTFRTKVRDYYRRNYPLTEAASSKPDLNPGNGRVCDLCHEPRVGLAVLHEMLAPYLADGRVTILLRTRPVACATTGDRVRSVSFKHRDSGRELEIRASYVLDATELGDVLPLAAAESVTGFESRRETDEAHAPEQAQPNCQQAFTVCFAMDHRPGEDHTVDRPSSYQEWKERVDPKLAWSPSRRLFELVDPHSPQAMGRIVFDPAREEAGDFDGLWRYRRLLDKSNFAAGTLASSVSLVNWPQNDYYFGNLIGVSADERAHHINRAKELSLSLLHWLQTEAPRFDGGQGWPGLRLRPDVCGTEDGLAQHPYIRESRRIKAVFTVTENHVSFYARRAFTGKPDGDFEAEPFPDSVGVGAFPIDQHISSEPALAPELPGHASLPFRIPLGSLLCQRLENLLPAAKNLGVTHIANGCFRLHPVEWAVGEAAGLLASFCLQRITTPHAVRARTVLLTDFQSVLGAHGVPLTWPRDIAVQKVHWGELF